MNGLTGLDIERAKYDIEEFETLASRSRMDLHNSFYKLYTFLNEHWASPAAVQFTRKNAQEINELNKDMGKTAADIVDGAISVAENLAEANDASFTLRSERNFARDPGGFYGEPCEPCKETLYNITGMDVEGVKEAIKIFRTSINIALDEIDSLPNGIHFYDPNGDMVGGYNRGVDSFKQKYRNLAEQTYSAMRSYIETEADKIFRSKQNATNTLNE